MSLLLLVLCLSLALLSLGFSSSKTFGTLTKGAFLTTEDVLISRPHSIFTAGFFRVGENAYCFSIWFSEPFDQENFTIVWMANRDQPVNGKHTKFLLQNSGNILLTDAGQLTAWTTNTKSNSSLQLELHDSGNLVLETSTGENLWQSFDFPTNTLLPRQLFTQNTVLVSSRSKTNHSSGFYNLYFDSDGILRLRYEDPEITSVYWPSSWMSLMASGRSAFNNSKIAMLDSSGHFQASDLFEFRTVDSDADVEPRRRLVLDVNGNLQVYSLDKDTRSWQVTWQAISEQCRIHGICGSNSLCTSEPSTGRRCTCLPGYKMKNSTDWSYGCEPEFELSCYDKTASGFIRLPHVEFYGFDIGFFPNYTFERCRDLCLKYCECKGFQYRFGLIKGYYTCFPKSMLFNGYRSVNFPDPMFIRLPETTAASSSKEPAGQDQDFSLQCRDLVIPLERPYRTKKHNWIKSFLWCTLVVGAFEVICLLTFLLKTRTRPNSRIQGYIQVATRFRRFSYAELKKATRNFNQEIGRGGGGVVYRGVLSDDRAAAIKCLKEANNVEAEFLTEVSIIGRLNHMNLIETWGYCAEGKHRLLVYEYMEHGSLAENLYGNNLDWKKRYEIALGTAKGLAYLQEECLEWVLHCDVKPQNILLGSNYQPKVADFGLSKLLKRNGVDSLRFSKIRGTRGYMAPEWVFNLPITSKADVYSYGIVVLELVTGKSPSVGHSNVNTSRAVEPMRLVAWVKKKLQEADERALAAAITEIVDPAMNGEFDETKMEILLKVAIQCVEEDKDARPTMSQVVDMLLQSHDSVPDSLLLV